MAAVECTFVVASAAPPETFGKFNTITLISEAAHTLDDFRAATNYALCEIFRKLRVCAGAAGPFQQACQSMLPAAFRQYTLATADRAGCRRVGGTDKMMAALVGVQMKAPKGISVHQMLVSAAENTDDPRPLDRVVLRDLKTNLNGKGATVVRFCPDRAKYCVRLDGCRRKVCVARANLCAARSAIYLSVKALRSGSEGVVTF